MRISVNLATRPFLELGPVFARLRLVMAVLAVTAIALGVWLHVVSGRAHAQEAQMHQLKAQTAAFEQERARNEARMRQPGNRVVLERAKFLNEVFATKSFSWTSVMTDLERVLPAGVQVTSIEPAVSAEGDVSIHLRVSGPRELSVELMRNLERSQRFREPRLVNETAQAQDQARALPVGMAVGGVEFDILSGYNPLPPAVKVSQGKVGGAMGVEQKSPAAAAVKRNSTRSAASQHPSGSGNPAGAMVTRPLQGASSPANGGGR